MSVLDNKIKLFLDAIRNKKTAHTQKSSAEAESNKNAEQEQLKSTGWETDPFTIICLELKDWEPWKDFALISYVNSSSVVLGLDKWKIHMTLIFRERVIFYSDRSENEKFIKASESIFFYCWF